MPVVVMMDGRALLADEGDYWSVYGVNPPGFVSCADTRSEALEQFRVDWMASLKHFADGNTDHERFTTELAKFLGQVDLGIETQWWSALDAKRAEKFEVPDGAIPAEEDIRFTIAHAEGKNDDGELMWTGNEATRDGRFRPEAQPAAPVVDRPAPVQSGPPEVLTQLATAC
jgi:hypothetical protein